MSCQRARAPLVDTRSNARETRIQARGSGGTRENARIARNPACVRQRATWNARAARTFDHAGSGMNNRRPRRRLNVHRRRDARHADTGGGQVVFALQAMAMDEAPARPFALAACPDAVEAGNARLPRIRGHGLSGARMIVRYPRIHAGVIVHVVANARSSRISGDVERRSPKTTCPPPAPQRHPRISR